MNWFFADALSVLRSRPDTFVATETTLVRLLDDDELPQEKLVTLIAGTRNLRALVIKQWDFFTWDLEGVQRIVSSGALQNIHSFTIGWRGALDMTTLFSMLANMPQLKRIAFGSIFWAEDVNPSEPPDLPIPACALTHVLVADDLSISFAEYPRLLASSRQSLIHFEAHWVNDLYSGIRLAQALETCTNVQHLTLIGCIGFNHERLLAACPKLRSLCIENDTLGFDSEPRPPIQHQIAEGVVVTFAPKHRAVPPPYLQSLSFHDVVGGVDDHDDRFFEDCQSAWHESILPHAQPPGYIRTMRIRLKDNGSPPSANLVAIREWCRLNRVRLSHSSTGEWERMGLVG